MLLTLEVMLLISTLAPYSTAQHTTKMEMPIIQKQGDPPRQTNDLKPSTDAPDPVPWGKSCLFFRVGDALTVECWLLMYQLYVFWLLVLVFWL